jgi:hypothetical protein
VLRARNGMQIGKNTPFMVVQLPPPTHLDLSLIQDGVRGLHDVRGEEEDSDEQSGQGLDR